MKEKSKTFDYVLTFAKSLMLTFVPSATAIQYGLQKHRLWKAVTLSVVIRLRHQ